MKVFNTIIKILALLAVIAGIVFVIAAYGDKIVAWTRRLMRKIVGHFKGVRTFPCDEEVVEEEVAAEDADFEG